MQVLILRVAQVTCQQQCLKHGIFERCRQRPFRVESSAGDDASISRWVATACVRADICTNDYQWHWASLKKLNITRLRVYSHGLPFGG